jgi:uncharacterized protein (DUF58 family)
VEFSQFRRYQPGDPLKHVDWKMFGKTDKFYIKEYEDETNLRAYILLDQSLSMNYSHGASITKLNYCKHLAAALVHLILGQRDAVGFVQVSDQAEMIIPPRAVSTQSMQLLKTIQTMEARNKTDLAICLHRLAEEIKKRSLIIMLSDLFDDPQSLMTGLKHFRHNGHELIVFHVLDPAECTFDVGEGDRLEDMESGEIFKCDPHEIKKEYVTSFRTWRENLEKACLDNLIDYFLVNTDTPFDYALFSFLQKRKTYS